MWVDDIDTFFQGFKKNDFLSLTMNAYFISILTFLIGNQSN